MTSAPSGRSTDRMLPPRVLVVELMPEDMNPLLAPTLHDSETMAPEAAEAREATSS